MLAGLVLACMVACTSRGDTSKSPAGTPTDPVDTCERLADVCRVNNSSQLGVCTAPPAEKHATLCGDRKPCFICAPQH